MSHSIAFGWINHDISRAPETDRARVHRLADRLGYHLVWPGEHSVLRVADQARNAGADLVILPARDHLGPARTRRRTGRLRRGNRATAPQLPTQDTP